MHSAETRPNCTRSSQPHIPIIPINIIISQKWSLKRELRVESPKLSRRVKAQTVIRQLGGFRNLTIYIIDPAIRARGFRTDAL